jgi:type IV pilus assembly protein PilO
MAAKLDLKSLPSAARIALAVLPSVIVIALVFFLAISPKQKEIAQLEKTIDEQANKIATNQKKAASLDILMKESEALQGRLKELREKLPEEKEISGLLKQISDLTTSSGLDLKSWRPGAKTNHPSGIVAETPVQLSVQGVYHDFGTFLGNLTKFSRIVNVSNIQFAGAQNVRGRLLLTINFSAAAYSSISAEAAPADAGKAGVKK